MANLRTQNTAVVPPHLPISPQRQPLPLPISPQRQPPPSPLSPLHPQSQIEAQTSRLRRRASHAQLSSAGLGAPYEAPLPSFPPPPLPPPSSMVPVRVPGLSEPASLHYASQKSHTTTSILASPQIPSSRVLSHTASSSRKALMVEHQYTPSPASTSLRKRSRTVVGSSRECGGNTDPRIVHLHLDADLGVGTDPNLDGKGCAGSSKGHMRHMSTSMLHLQPQTRPPVVDGGPNALAADERIDHGPTSSQEEQFESTSAA